MKPCADTVEKSTWHLQWLLTASYSKCGCDDPGDNHMAFDDTRIILWYTVIHFSVSREFAWGEFNYWVKVSKWFSSDIYIYIIPIYYVYKIYTYTHILCIYIYICLCFNMSLSLVATPGPWGPFFATALRYSEGIPNHRAGKWVHRLKTSLGIWKEDSLKGRTIKSYLWSSIWWIITFHNLNSRHIEFPVQCLGFCCF